MSDQETPFTPSFRGASSPNSYLQSGSSSKAVLAALRALQDKIRRVESEKAQILDENKQLKLKIQSHEIDFAHYKQKEKLNLHKNLSEIRNSYEIALVEKNELEDRLLKLDGKNKDMKEYSENLLEKIKAAEAEKHHFEFKYKDVQAKLLQLEVQHERSQQREKGDLITFI